MNKQKHKTKPRRLTVPKRLTVLLITVTLLLVPIVLYFTLYISSRTNYLTNRDFRQLASISGQLEDRIDQLKGLFVRAVKQTVIDQSSESKKASQDRVLNRPTEKATTKTPQEMFQHNLGLALQSVIPPEMQKSSSWQFVTQYLNEMDSAVSMRLVTGGETSTIYFVWCGPPDCSVRAEASARLEDLVTPLTGKRSLESLKGAEHKEGFDSIVIASVTDENPTAEQKSESEKKSAGRTVSSKVIFQQGSSDLDIDSLDNLARADVLDKYVDLGTLSENSTTAEIALADTTYRIYSQPIEIPIKTDVSEPANDPNKAPALGRQSEAGGNKSYSGRLSETHWVVCGLVQAGHFRREAWAFPYTWLIVLVFVTVVIALSWPFLKLQFIGPKDRLKLADVYWLGFSLLIGSAILTLFMLFGVGYIRSEDLFDGQLTQFSDQINRNFQQEIQTILDQLSDLKRLGDADLKSLPQHKVRKANDFVQPSLRSIPIRVELTFFRTKRCETVSIPSFIQQYGWMKTVNGDLNGPSIRLKARVAFETEIILGVLKRVILAA